MPPSPPDKRWFVHIDNQTYDPYSGQEIEEFAEDGRIKATDLLCPEGGSAWIEAKNEPTLSSLFPTHHAAPRPRMAATAGAARMRDQTRDRSSVIGDRVATAVGKPWWKRFGYDPAPLFQRTDQELIREDLHAFFGPRADKFLAVYDKMRAVKKPYVVAWSWPVFLTIFVWHFYRKMYLMGAILMLLQFVGIFIFGIYGFVVFGATLGASAKRLYVLRAMQRLEKAEALGLVGKERQDYLQRAGGVSVLAGALAATIQAMYVALTVYGIYLMVS